MTPIRKILIANRGEIAARIAQAAADLSRQSVAVYSRDDTLASHLRAADHAVALDQSGAKAYLDANAMIVAAKETGRRRRWSTGRC